MACALFACAECSSASSRLGDGPCVAAGTPATLAEVPEASGVALSRRTPGVLWSHNDSGQPVLAAFDKSGAARGRVRIPNASVEDWEDVSVARCPSGPCLYIADIGDNEEIRKQVTVYRIPEPQPQDGQSQPAEIFTATYPDGPHDAEALFIVGDDVYIVTKGATTALYRFPKPMRAGTAMRLERVADLPLKRVTDAETSSDGSWVAIRTGEEVAFYRAADMARAGSPAVTMALQGLNEPQGEGVAVDTGGMVYLTSEAQRAGRLTVLRCTLPK